MIHVTCDHSGKELRPKEDQRFVVKIEAYAAHDPHELTEADLDEDNIEAIAQMLRDLEEEGGESQDPVEAYKEFRFDLCGDCHKRFVRNPLAKEAVKFDFSEN
jgi:hypothetical protein